MTQIVLSASEKRREDRLYLGTFAFGHFANDWTAGSLLLLTPAIALTMDLGPEQIGLMLTINGIGGGLAYLPAGLAADHTRYRGWLLWSTFVWVAIGYFVASFAVGYWPLTLLLAVAVMGDAAWHPMATGVLTQKMPLNKARALGVHAMGGTIGAEAVAPLVVGALLLWFDWRTVMQISVLPVMVAAVLFLPMVKRIGATPTQQFKLQALLGMLRKWRTPLGLGLITFAIIYNMATVAAIAMTPLFLTTRHDLSPLQAGIVFAIMVGIGSILQPIVGHLSDRLGRKLLLVVLLGASALFGLGAAYATGFAVFVVCLVAAVALLTAIRPVVLATAVEISEERESTTLGVAFTLMDGVGAFGAVFAGFAGRHDLSNAFFMVGILALVACGVAAMLPLKRTVFGAP